MMVYLIGGKWNLALDPFDAADALLDSDGDGHDRNRNGILEEEEFFTNLMEFEIRNMLGNSTNPKILTLTMMACLMDGKFTIILIL